jgi:hypothetical protein
MQLMKVDRAQSTVCAYVLVFPFGNCHTEGMPAPKPNAFWKFVRSMRCIPGLSVPLPGFYI